MSGKAQAEKDRIIGELVEAHVNAQSTCGTQQRGTGRGERILTNHPQPGKQGVNIDRRKYEMIREAILECIGAQGEITFKELTAEVRRRLAGSFEGSISWYVTTVKLDLEARGEIERIPGRKPQHLRLTAK
jgi:hypothetical protein